MAYLTSNPPFLMSGGSLTTSGIRLWGYKSTHTSTSISGVAGFFTNGRSLGMRKGDSIICIKNSTAATAYEQMIGRVTAASSTGTAATVKATKVSTA